MGISQAQQISPTVAGIDGRIPVVMGMPTKIPPGTQANEIKRDHGSHPSAWPKSGEEDDTR